MPPVNTFTKAKKIYSLENTFTNPDMLLQSQEQNRTGRYNKQEVLVANHSNSKVNGICEIMMDSGVSMTNMSASLSIAMHFTVQLATISTHPVLCFYHSWVLLAYLSGLFCVLLVVRQEGGNGNV